ncbi:MAG: fatty acid hydroxylase family protein [Planctomycetota bacterium]|nr:MAG: fatty acid hydroxylase family protein [Planctomycetota bacterium]
MSLSLAAAARAYAAHASPQIVLSALAVTLGARLALGQWSGGDLAVSAGVLLYWPFMEWGVHVYVLHSTPRTWLGRRLYAAFGARHRRHHRQPADVELAFLPVRGIVAALGAYAALSLLLPAWELRLTLLAGVSALGVVYEWTHFLCHVPYRPRTRWFRNVRRIHRLHHYQNERAWYGVTTHLGDRLLRTFPRPQAVARLSPDR